MRRKPVQVQDEEKERRMMRTRKSARPTTTALETKNAFYRAAPAPF
jgi:hypothetical protein